MKVKKKILNIAKRNTLLIEFLYNNYKKNEEKHLIDLIDMLRKTDTINDIQPLVNFKKDIVNENKIFCTHNINQTNYRLYGIGEVLFSFSNPEVKFLPSFEHGLILFNQNWTDTADTCRASCVTFGPFRKKILQRYYNTPIFEVGPYIQYATGYYDKEKVLKVKNEMGKTLLLFPSHGTDQDDVFFNEEEYINKLQGLESSYQTIMVCVYWWNIDNQFIQRLANKGYKIVSAGFREDPNFLRRLRTIIELSDDVLSDSIGTHIGYCASLNKRIRMIHVETQYGHKKTDNLIFRDKQIQKIKNAIDKYSEQEFYEMLNFYWGSNIKLTKEELSDVQEINRAITIAGKYCVKKYANVAYELLEDYRKNDFSKYRLLDKALN